MTKDEMLAQLTQIGTCEDDTQRRSLISSISGEIGTLYENNATLTASNKNYETVNEQLRSANLDLFLQIGNKTKPDSPTGKEEGEKKPLKYEDLFDEKGEIK